MSNNAVTKGIDFELRVESILKKCGLKVWRTNKTNPHDPANYKHGFDGGVDIIATFESNQPYERHFDFYIQCKDHKNGINKTAMAEVFGGMNVRHVPESYSVPVVVAHGEVSQEIRLYAKELGVELFLSTEIKLVENASKCKRACFGHYGILLKALLYSCTKDDIWVQTMPENTNRLSEMSVTEKLLRSTISGTDRIESYVESAYRHSIMSYEDIQKAISLQKIMNCRVLEAAIKVEKQCREIKQTTKKETPKLDDDTG